MVFTLPYGLEIMKAWVKAAENTQSLRQLEENIVQAVRTDDRTRGKETEQVTESVFQFCCWQYDDLGRTEFADRLFKAFLYSPLRSSVPMPAHIASRLAQFVQEKRAWAVQSYTEITRLVAWKCVESLDPVRLLLEQYPKDQQFEEQIVVGVILNIKLGIEIMDLMWKEWPDQVAVTPKILEACLVDNGDTVGSYCLMLLLRKRSHQIQITDSLLQSVARRPYCVTWEVLLWEYETQINMTQDIFHASLRKLNGRRESVNSLLRNLLRMWPTETRITNETLLIIMRRVALSIDVIVLFSKVRHREFGAAIDGEVLVALVERGAFKTLNSRSRTLVDFFFKRYPDECRASITDEVLSKIENMKDGHVVAEYFDAFQQGLINDLTIVLDVRPKSLNIDLMKTVGRRTADAIYGWNGLAGRHGNF